MLPRHMSEGFFRNGLGREMRTLEYYQSRVDPLFPGRPYTSTAYERFYHFFCFLRDPSFQRTVQKNARFSAGTISIEIQHACWATIHSLFWHGSYEWPPTTTLLDQWDRVPTFIKRGFPNSDHQVYPLVMDTSFRNLPDGIKPANLTDYYCGKKNVKRHVFGNLYICDLRGRIVWSSVGNPFMGGEHFMLRAANISMRLDDYFPDPRIRVVTDGLFRGVTPRWDEILFLPHGGNGLTNFQTSQNSFIKMVGALIENVHNDLDQVFPIIKKPIVCYN
jgi:hypothetical protein